VSHLGGVHLQLNILFQLNKYLSQQCYSEKIA
jgi:hypothetical protein